MARGAPGRCGVLLLLGGLLALAPLGAAESGGAVTDPPGDVAYSDLYVGPQDHDYLDMLGADWAFDPLRDEVSLRVSGVDFTAYGEPANPDIQVICAANAQVHLDGKNQALVQIRYWNPPGDDAYESRVLLVPQTRGAATAIPLEHRVIGTFAAPGTLDYRLSRHALLAYGDELHQLSLNCTENYFPGGWPEVDAPMRPAPFIFNFDSAPNATTPYQLRNLTPLRTEEGDEAFGRENQSGPNGAEASPGGAASPWPGLAVAVIVAAGVATIRRAHFRS